MIARRGRAQAWAFATLLVAAGVSAYANTLSNPFVFDDSASVVNNDTIRSITRAIWAGPAQSPTAGRPVPNISLAINYAVGGLSPAGYHVWNLAVHVLCALLLFGIVRRTLERRETPLEAESARRHFVREERGKTRTGSPANSAVSAINPRRRRVDETTAARFPASSWLAFACALLWLLHPLQTEVINYVTQRTESMMGLAYLLTLYAAIRGRIGIAVVSCALGMLTKESMVTAPMMVLLYDVVFIGGSLARALKERWPGYAALAATWVLLFAAMATGPRSRSAGFSSGVSAWTYLLNQPQIIVEYLRRALWPTGLVLDYGEPRTLIVPDVLPAAAIVLLLLAATSVAWFHRRELAYLGIWFFVTLAPTSSFVPIATEVGAERRMYLPLAALVVAVVLSVEAAVRRVASPASRRMVNAGVLAAAVCGLLALTIQRNQEYATGTRIWQTVLDRRPHGRAHHNLGLHLMEEGRRTEALAHYEEALSDTPEAHYALGFELDASGNRLKAIEHYREYIRLRPEDVNVIRAYNLLGRALTEEGRAAEAVAVFQQVVRMEPDNIDAIGGIADIAFREERFDDAIRAYEGYIRLAPENAVARFNLGLALASANRGEEAVGAFLGAISLNSQDARFRVTLAEVLLTLGRVQEAAAQYSAAVQLQPDDQELFARMTEVVRAAQEGASSKVRR